MGRDSLRIECNGEGGSLRKGDGRGRQRCCMRGILAALNQGWQQRHRSRQRGLRSRGVNRAGRCSGWRAGGERCMRRKIACLRVGVRETWRYCRARLPHQLRKKGVEIRVAEAAAVAPGRRPCAAARAAHEFEVRVGVENAARTCASWSGSAIGIGSSCNLIQFAHPQIRDLSKDGGGRGRGRGGGGGEGNWGMRWVRWDDEGRRRGGGETSDVES
jgi:hypothetical protein